ncbi:MAG: F0F1 ATP synthase subunit epsilon [Pseudomonadota bacterium]
MADMMQFDLVSPERSVASLQASEVQIPGAEGDFTAMPDHAPVLTTLRPGVLVVTTPSGSESYFVTGGFAEVTPAGTSVLAERAYAKADVTREMLDEMIQEANTARDAAPAETLDMAAKFAADLAAAGEQISL